MTLPPSAIERLSSPLRSAWALSRPARDFHTVPIDETSWRLHADALAESVSYLSLLLAPPNAGFRELKEWTEQVLRQRTRVASFLFALEPFEPYDPAQADELLGLLDQLPHAVIDALETRTHVDARIIQALASASTWWSARNTPQDDGEQAIARAFGMQLWSDTDGRFRAEWVLQHYAHRASDLLSRLVPHLVSLGIPYVTDVLAGVFAVGQILDCDDPIAAYIATDMLLNRFLAADPTVAAQTREHLRATEPAIRRARSAARRAYSSVLAPTEDPEGRALALADAYKRTIEGPFRQYSWAAHCLCTGAWRTPPTLTNLRERVISEGGALAAVVGDVVLPNMRNSETHETLVWDGFAEQFVTESGRVDAVQVAAALSLATAFVHGSEAGLAAIRALHIQADAGILPFADEEGRMPTWDRVRAFFGTNRIVLIEARLNSPHARFRVQRIEHRDINPCFQALVLARRLLPKTERFEVSTVDSNGLLIVVDADALDATMLSWDFAVAHLDQMPLSTFLPANLDARMKLESEPVAVRSTAWIAVDDAVGVIDGSPEHWDEGTRQLLDIRLQLVEIAVASTRQWIAAPNTRLESVQESVAELRSWISNESPLQAVSADSQPSMSRLRAQWSRWGPVPRHPLIPEVPPAGEVQAQPALRAAPESTHYRTL